MSFISLALVTQDLHISSESRTAAVDMVQTCSRPVTTRTARLSPTRWAQSDLGLGSLRFLFNMSKSLSLLVFIALWSVVFSVKKRKRTSGSAGERAVPRALSTSAGGGLLISNAFPLYRGIETHQSHRTMLARPQSTLGVFPRS